MKKYILLFTILFVLAGCTHMSDIGKTTPPPISNPEIPPGSETQWFSANRLAFLNTKGLQIEERKTNEGTEWDVMWSDSGNPGVAPMTVGHIASPTEEQLQKIKDIPTDILSPLQIFETAGTDTWHEQAIRTSYGDFFLLRCVSPCESLGRVWFAFDPAKTMLQQPTAPEDISGRWKIDDELSIEFRLQPSLFEIEYPTTEKRYDYVIYMNVEGKGKPIAVDEGSWALTNSKLRRYTKSGELSDEYQIFLSKDNTYARVLTNDGRMTEQWERI